MLPWLPAVVGLLYKFLFNPTPELVHLQSFLRLNNHTSLDNEVYGSMITFLNWKIYTIYQVVVVERFFTLSLLHSFTSH